MHTLQWRRLSFVFCLSAVLLKGIPRPPHRLLFSISSEGFLYALPQTGQHIPRHLMNQLKVIVTEYCPRYNNTDGKLILGFYCPVTLRLISRNEYYCCGNTSNFYCCNDITKSTYTHATTKIEAYWIEYWPYFAFIGALMVFAICTPFIRPENS